jgi:MFS transporter, MHS family, proline/betaine transporter
MVNLTGAGATHLDGAVSSRANSQTPNMRTKTVVAVALGNAMEWYDFALTAFLATQLAKNFFPQSTPLTGLLNVLAVFGIAFVFRPLGGLVLGPLADSKGRMFSLLITLGVMASATFCVGLLPTESSVGVLAPVLLVLLRILQGFSAGAETGTAVTYLIEHSSPRHRGFVCSFVQASSICGFLIASLVIFLVNRALSPPEMGDWGWRIPFLLALPFGLVSFYIRWKLEETPEFRQLQLSGHVSKTPFTTAITRNWRALVQIAAMSAVQFVGYYTAFAYFPGHLTRLGFAPAQVATATTFTLISAALVVPAFGALSDVVGRKPVLLGAALALLVLPVPLFAAMPSLSLPWVIFCQVAMAMAVAAYNSSTGVTNAESLEVSTRAATMSIGFNIGTILFGAPTLYVMTLINTTILVSWAPGLYVAAAAAISLLGVATLRRSPEGASGGKSRSRAQHGI